MPLETPKVATATSNGDITLKEEKEVNLEAEYIDNRSVTISSVHNYSMFRKTNMKVMGQRKDTIGSCISFANSSFLLTSYSESVLLISCFVLGSI